MRLVGRVACLSAAGCVALLGAPAALAVEPIDFSLPVASPLVTMPKIDLDGDGRLDHVSLSVYRGSPSGMYTLVDLHVQTNLGRGVLGPKTVSRIDSLTPLGYSSTIVVVDDLDGDGRRDLVVRTVVGREFHTGMASFVRNLGNNRFARGIPIGEAGSRPFFATHDFDADGRPDLVSFASEYDGDTGTIEVRRNLGGGSFADPVRFTGSGYNRPVAFGDLNGDGHDDLIAGGAGTFFPGLGGCAFGLPVHWGEVARAYGLFAPDVDSDGDIDLVRMLERRLDILVNTGSGAFQVRSIAAGSQAAPFFGDLNADGRPDFALADSSAVHLVIARPDGGYDVRRFSNVFYRYETGPRVLESLDLDRDGWLDLLATSGMLGITPIVSSNHSGWEARARVARFSHDGSLWPVADIDEDGAPEVYVAYPAGGFGVLRIAADGSCIAPLSFPKEFLGPRFLFDLDGDGAEEHLVRHGGDGFRVSLLSAGGHNTELVARSWANAALGSAKDMCVAQLNGNRAVDLVVARQGGITCAFDFLTSSTSQLDLAVGAAPTSVTSGDVDGDGDVDLITNGWLSYLILLLNDGTGQFPSLSYIEAGTPGWVAAGDFDGDSVLDLVTRTDNAVGVLRGHGDGTFDSPANLEVPGSHNLRIELADVDRDGRIDLLAQASDGLRLYRSRAGLGFELLRTLGFGIGYIHAGDVDGDRDVDVVGVTPQTIDVFRNDGAGNFAYESLAPGLALDDPVAGDPDGDGRMDVIGGSWYFPNRTPTATPVVLQEFVAEPALGQLRLRWRLTPEVQASVAALRIERSTAPRGPFVVISDPRLEPTIESFTDESPVPRAWYRLVLVLRDGALLATPAIEGGAIARESELISAAQSARGASVSIHFRVGAAGETVVSVLDVRGRRIRTLLAGRRPADQYRLAWDGRDERGRPVARGLYLVELRVGGFHDAHKVLVWSR